MHQSNTLHPFTSLLASSSGFIGSAVLFGILVLSSLAIIPLSYIVSHNSTDNRSDANSGESCAWCAGAEQCWQSTGKAPESGGNVAVCGGNMPCCMGYTPPGTATTQAPAAPAAPATPSNKCSPESSASSCRDRDIGTNHGECTCQQYNNEKDAQGRPKCWCPATSAPATSQCAKVGDCIGGKTCVYYNGKLDPIGAACGAVSTDGNKTHLTDCNQLCGDYDTCTCASSCVRSETKIFESCDGIKPALNQAKDIVIPVCQSGEKLCKDSSSYVTCVGGQWGTAISKCSAISSTNTTCSGYQCVPTTCPNGGTLYTVDACKTRVQTGDGGSCVAASDSTNRCWVAPVAGTCSTNTTTYSDATKCTQACLGECTTDTKGAKRCCQPPTNQCTPGSYECSNNTAKNCIYDSTQKRYILKETPCTTSQTCTAYNSEARCQTKSITCWRNTSSKCESFTASNCTGAYTSQSACDSAAKQACIVKQGQITGNDYGKATTTCSSNGGTWSDFTCGCSKDIFVSTPPQQYCCIDSQTPAANPQITSSDKCKEAYPGGWRFTDHSCNSQIVQDQLAQLHSSLATPEENIRLGCCTYKDSQGQTLSVKSLSEIECNQRATNNTWNPDDPRCQNTPTPYIPTTTTQSTCYTIKDNICQGHNAFACIPLFILSSSTTYQNIETCRSHLSIPSQSGFGVVINETQDTTTPPSSTSKTCWQKNDQGQCYSFQVNSDHQCTYDSNSACVESLKDKKTSSLKSCTVQCTDPDNCICELATCNTPQGKTISIGYNCNDYFASTPVQTCQSQIQSSLIKKLQHNSCLASQKIPFLNAQWDYGKCTCVTSKLSPTQVCIKDKFNNNAEAYDIAQISCLGHGTWSDDKCECIPNPPQNPNVDTSPDQTSFEIDVFPKETTSLPIEGCNPMLEPNCCSNTENTALICRGKYLGITDASYGRSRCYDCQPGQNFETTHWCRSIEINDINICNPPPVCCSYSLTMTSVPLDDGSNRPINPITTNYLVKNIISKETCIEHNGTIIKEYSVAPSLIPDPEKSLCDSSVLVETIASQHTDLQDEALLTTNNPEQTQLSIFRNYQSKISSSSTYQSISCSCQKTPFLKNICTLIGMTCPKYNQQQETLPIPIQPPNQTELTDIPEPLVGEIGIEFKRLTIDDFHRACMQALQDNSAQVLLAGTRAGDIYCKKSDGSCIGFDKIHGVGGVNGICSDDKFYGPDWKYAGVFSNSPDQWFCSNVPIPEPYQDKQYLDNNTLTTPFNPATCTRIDLP